MTIPICTSMSTSTSIAVSISIPVSISISISIPIPIPMSIYPKDLHYHRDDIQTPSHPRTKPEYTVHQPYIKRS